MVLTANVYEYFGQKVMYVEELNYYFGIKPESDVKLGRYKLDKDEICKIAKENDPEEYKVFKQTSIHDRMQRIKCFDKEEYVSSGIKGEFTLCLHPSRVCNLNCKYCFKESEYLGNQSLDIESAKAAIDFLTDTYAPMAEHYMIDLSGSGEPLVKIDLIKEIVKYCEEKRNKVFKNIGVMFASNLTMLTPEIAEYLDNESYIILGTSIDGDQVTHDNNRVYANGKGTYEDVVKALQMFQKKKFGIGAAVTLTPLNQNVDEIYDHLYNLPNVDCISMRYVRSFDGGEYDFDKFDAKYLASRYEKLCENIITNVRAGKPDYLTKMLKGSDFFGGMLTIDLIKGVTQWQRCDAGRNRIVINHKGDVYACSVFINNDDFCMGNIHDNPPVYGADERFWSVSKQKNDKCSGCPIYNLCGGECYGNGYLKYGDMYKPIDRMCEIKIELHKLAMAFIQKLKLEYKDVFKVLVDFSLSSNENHFIKPADWVTTTYLKCLGFDVKYDTIHDNFNNVDFQNKKEVLGIILKCIKEYKPDIDLYKISLDDEITYPAISILNNSEYFLILGEESGNFVVSDLNCKVDETYLYSKKKLISKSNGIIIA